MFRPCGMLISYGYDELYGLPGDPGHPPSFGRPGEALQAFWAPLDIPLDPLIQGAFSYPEPAAGDAGVFYASCNARPRQASPWPLWRDPPPWPSSLFSFGGEASYDRYWYWFLLNLSWTPPCSVFYYKASIGGVHHVYEPGQGKPASLLQSALYF